MSVQGSLSIQSSNFKGSFRYLQVEKGESFRIKNRQGSGLQEIIEGQSLSSDEDKPDPSYLQPLHQPSPNSGSPCIPQPIQNPDPVD